MYYDVDEFDDAFVSVIAKRAGVEDLDAAKKVMDALNKYTRGSRIDRNQYDYGDEGHGNAMADAISTFVSEFGSWLGGYGAGEERHVPQILTAKLEDLSWAENYWRTHGGTVNDV